MNRWKLILVCVIGIIIGVLGGLIALPVAKAAWGPPRVTVMNATGEDISDVTVKLGTVRQCVSDIKDGYSRTVPVRGHFSESSTHISWTDSTGKHYENAGDYMENFGGYHAIVVLTPDRKAKAIYETKESNKRHGTH